MANVPIKYPRDSGCLTHRKKHAVSSGSCTVCAVWILPASSFFSRNINPPEPSSTVSLHTSLARDFPLTSRRVSTASPFQRVVISGARINGIFIRAFQDSQLAVGRLLSPNRLLSPSICESGSDRKVAGTFLSPIADHPVLELSFS